MDWVVEYDMLLMNFICRLSLDLNTWCIVVEGGADDIDLPRMSDIWFEINRCTFY